MKRIEGRTDWERNRNIGGRRGRKRWHELVKRQTQTEAGNMYISF